MAENLSTLSSTGTEGTPTGTGKRYVLISAWESEQQGLHTAPDTSVLECYGDFPTGLDDEVIINGWIVDATSNITIRAAAGNGHGGVIGAGFYINTETAGATSAIRIQVAHTVIEDIEVINTSVLLNARGVHINADNCKLSRVISNAAGEGGSGHGFYFETPAGDLYNCLAYNCSGFGFHATNYRSPVIYSCTSVGNLAGGFSRLSTNGTANLYKDCVAFDNAGGDFVGVFNASSEYNASGDTSAPPANSVTGVDAGDFTNYSSLEFTPSIGGALDGDINPAADLSTEFTDDITGFTRTVPWDIGAYAVQGGVVPTPPTDVDAGPGYSGTVGTPIAIDGASYTPGTGSPDVILWTFIGPGGTWDDDSILSPTFTPDGVDTYALTLTVTNDTGSGADTASLTVTAATLNEMYIKDGGTFKQATPYIKEGGVFVAADAYVRSGGAWVKVQDK